LKRISQLIMVFVGFIGTGIGKNRKHHLEVVDLYKQRILALEIELEEAKAEKYKYEQMLFKELGIIAKEQNREINKAFEEVNRNPMSPGRMRNFLESKSRIQSKQQENK
jgi:hypothetical protein